MIFPLRLTPLERVLALGGREGRETSTARRWYRSHGRRVTIVIPSYRDAELVRRLVTKLRQTVDPERMRIIVADDASGPEQIAALRMIDGIELVIGDHNAGFAANVNRGLAAADPTDDIVLLNSDVVPQRGWLAALQHAAYRRPGIGIAGARLLYPTNRIQYAGTIRNPSAPDWFDHRHRGKPANWGPANVAGPTLAATGACMYIRGTARERIGDFDEAFPMGFEDVDYCLRCWQAGLDVVYAPTSRLYHLESATRGTRQGERELRSQQVFWEKWTPFFSGRDTTTEDGRQRIVYVTEDTIIAGGHRVVFDQLNGLAERGHDVQLWTLGTAPDWFELRCPVRTFADYDELVAALAPLDAIKVATWWRTALPVWRASVVRGVPVYLVQDIETSYYPDAPERRDEVLDTYRPEFSYLTTSGWNREGLAALGIEAAVISPGIDLGVFGPLAGAARDRDTVLALGRSNPLKNLPLTLSAWRALPVPRPTAAVRIRAGACRRGWDRLRREPQRCRRQRAAQSGNGVCPDVVARGVLPADSRGDGHRRSGRLHRRARQPRLLCRRRQLPDAGGRQRLGRRSDRPPAGRSRSPRAARAGRHRHRRGLRLAGTAGRARSVHGGAVARALRGALRIRGGC